MCSIANYVSSALVDMFMDYAVFMQRCLRKQNDNVAIGWRDTVFDQILPGAFNQVVFPGDILARLHSLQV